MRRVGAALLGLMLALAASGGQASADTNAAQRLAAHTPQLVQAGDGLSAAVERGAIDPAKAALLRAQALFHPNVVAAQHRPDHPHRRARGDADHGRPLPLRVAPPGRRSRGRRTAAGAARRGRRRSARGRVDDAGGTGKPGLRRQPLRALDGDRRGRAAGGRRQLGRRARLDRPDAVDAAARVDGRGRHDGLPRAEGRHLQHRQRRQRQAGRLPRRCRQRRVFGYVNSDDPHNDPAAGYDFFDESTYMVLDNNMASSQFGGLPPHRQPAGDGRARVLPHHPGRVRLVGRPLADGGHGDLDGGRRLRLRQPEP